MMTVTIIGIGLIGGSLGLCLREQGFAERVIGVDANPEHAQKALELSVVDEIMAIEDAVREADLVVVSVPVTSANRVLLEVLDKVDRQVVIDVGSTKTDLCAAVENHPKRGRFVATHPMWGTEFSGPEAATRYAFSGKAVVLCDHKASDSDAIKMIENMYRLLGMHILYMDAMNHDIHTAYISHISHITSFALANTVLEKEREEDAIFELASAGFESTVRLAKSNADTWVPIFMQNRDNVLDVLNEHITQLRKFKASLEKENWDYLRELITNANKIKRILK
jgi:prephenate dehydrogenase